MGHRFLRHVQRTALLALVVPLDSRDNAAELRSQRAELAHYSPELADRRHVVVLTKLDLAAAPPQDSLDLPAHTAVVAVSAAAHTGLDRLVATLFAQATVAGRTSGA